MSKAAKIAIIEDHEELGQAYKKRLQAEGFEVVHISNGEDALAHIVEVKPDLIMLDLKLPRISGFDVLDIIRNTSHTAHTPVVILTALSGEAEKQRALGLGADAYLVKSQTTSAQTVEVVKKFLSG
jgi:two-component system phosphate regulon response regulator PhoB